MHTDKIRLAILLSSLAVIAFLGSGHAEAAEAVTYTWNYEQIVAIKNGSNATERTRILKVADSKLRLSPMAVTDKAETISGDRHNYESMAVYYWPDPADSSKPYVVKDGQVNPESQQYDYPRIKQMGEIVKYTALAYFLTREQKYLDACIKQIDVWFIDKATAMNTNFDYAQFAPGHNGNRGIAGGFIEAQHFHDVMDAVRLVESVNAIGEERLRQLTSWFAAFAQWASTSDYGKSAAAFTNNHGVNYDLLLYDLYIFTDNKKGRRRLAKDFFAKRVRQQITADGLQPQELKRTKAFNYSILNLSFISRFCQMASRDGQDCSESEARLNKGISYLSQYLGHKENFPYQEIGDWQSEEQALRKVMNRATELGI